MRNEGPVGRGFCLPQLTTHGSVFSIQPSASQKCFRIIFHSISYINDITLWRVGRWISPRWRSQEFWETQAATTNSSYVVRLGKCDGEMMKLPPMMAKTWRKVHQQKTSDVHMTKWTVLFRGMSEISLKGFFLWILNENWSLLFFFSTVPLCIQTGECLHLILMDGERCHCHWDTFSNISGCCCPRWCEERLHNKKK